jgi:prepilin-type N-terminal cleavage/methylation domain-containing protein
MNKLLLVQNVKNGFTLVELLVTIVIAALLLTAVTQLFITSNRVYTVQEQVLRIQQEVRASINAIARDIRMAGYNPKNTANDAGFTVANATNMRVQYDYNENGTCDIDKEYQYNVSNNNLEVRRDAGGGYQTFVNNVDSMNFQYTLANGTTTYNPANTEKIRQVRINICGKISGGYGNTYDNSYCFNNVITCRNMGM